MNLQTEKPRAKWLPGSDPATCRMWKISHPHSGVRIWSELPHDGAIEMLRDWVLPKMTERGSK